MKSKESQTPGQAAVGTGKSDEASTKTGAPAGPFQLKTILVPVDFSSFSDKALDYAVAFARQFQASVILVHVVEPVVYPENYTTLPAVNDDIQSSLLRAAETRLADHCKRLEVDRIEVRPLTRLGRPFTEITDAAKELKVDLIILATHGYTGLKHVLLGSTAERVVRHAPCPVLTVRHPEHDFVPHNQATS